MHFKRLALALTALMTLAVAACGANADAPPPGVAAHLPGATAAAPANRPGGACHRLTRAQIRSVLGGSVSTPIADNMTPGLNRCDWRITKSRLDGGSLTLIAFQSDITARLSGTTHQRVLRTAKTKGGTVPVPQLGGGATWEPSQLTLGWPARSGNNRLQLLTPQGIHLNPDLVRNELMMLARVAR